MSHDATNWAIKQRGIKPAAKVVLWHLADRFHPDHGCFPSKETLSDDCEMSERSVYNQIVLLENAGLLVVSRRGGKSASGKFTSNEYILGCDPRFAQYDVKPSANFAVGRNKSAPSANSRENRRQNLPSNPVIEPVIKPVTVLSDKSKFGKEFEEIWPKFYAVKKCNKKPAKAKYITARKKASFEDISLGMNNYLKSRVGQDQQWTTHFAKWLNDESWVTWIDIGSTVSENQSRYKKIARSHQ